MINRLKHTGWLGALLLAACTGASDASRTETQQAATPSVATTESAPMPHENSPATVAFPEPGSVIYFIYDQKGDGSASYETANGSLATYWYGFPFELDGKRYFSGFVYATPQKFGDQLQQDPAPQAKVTLSVATFAASAPGAEKPWDFLGAQPYIGEFGGYERGNAVDEDRQSVTYLADDGRYYLAVPTSYMAGGGVSTRTFEIFVLNRGEDGMLWKYLGSVGGGAENSAGCDSDADSTGLPECFDNEGSLAFTAATVDAMPVIQVAMHGTDADASGKVEPLRTDDIADYIYDSGTSEYRQVEHH